MQPFSELLIGFPQHLILGDPYLKLSSDLNATYYKVIITLLLLTAPYLRWLNAGSTLRSFGFNLG
jgi:hypothetical protein